MKIVRLLKSNPIAVNYSSQFVLGGKSEDFKNAQKWLRNFENGCNFTNSNLHSATSKLCRLANCAEYTNSKQGAFYIFPINVRK